MVNGLGVLGWGVGGIEAEAAMLGQPVSMLIPRVVGFKLTGSLPAGTTATDLVLTITEMLRKHGVVGKFVEFYGDGVAAVPLANRATIGNMSPEFGSTAAMFPIDDETINYLRLTGRPDEQLALVEAYAKAQGLWHDPCARSRSSPSTSSSTCPRSSRRSPARSGRRTGSSWPTPCRSFRKALQGLRRPHDDTTHTVVDEAGWRRSRRVRRPMTRRHDPDPTRTYPTEPVSAASGASGRAVEADQGGDGRQEFELDHGARRRSPRSRRAPTRPTRR